MDFVLHSHSGAVGFHQEPVAGNPVHSPAEFQKRLFDQLESLHRGHDVDGAPVLRNEVFQELTSIGHDLYQMLFPREMRNIYREIRDQVKTLIVTSDEPWIPWEILRPAEFDDDDFLCMKFQMSRWLTGEIPLTSNKRIKRLLCIEPQEDAKLGSAGLESQLLRDLAEQTQGIDGSFLSGALSQDIVDLIERESFDLLHFAGHGEYDEHRPGESKITLADRPLRVRHLSPVAEKKLRQERPVVFFNTCQVGRFDHSLTGLDGWAPRWVRRCGCSAFLAPFWSIRDSRARRFAEIFYGKLYEGRTLGEAVLLARHKLREEDPGEMAWLAYSLYGHTNARIIFGDHQPVIGENAIVVPDTRRVNQQDSERATLDISPHRGPQATDPFGARPVIRRSSPRRYLALAALGVLAIVIALSSTLTDRWIDPRPQQEVATQGVAPVEPGSATPAQPDPVDGEIERASSPESPPPPDTKKPPIEVSRYVVPLLPLVPGKLAVVALGRKTRQPDPDVADAIEAALSRAVDDIFPMVPQLQEVEFVEKFLDGDFSALPDDGRSPWGAEYLLLATVSRREAPQTALHLEGVIMTLTAQLIATSNRSMKLRSTETHTGLGPTIEAALLQAAERCLREIAATLRGETSDDSAK